MTSFPFRRMRCIHYAPAPVYLSWLTKRGRSCYCCFCSNMFLVLISFINFFLFEFSPNWIKYEKACQILQSTLRERNFKGTAFGAFWYWEAHQFHRIHARLCLPFCPVYLARQPRPLALPRPKSAQIVITNVAKFRLEAPYTLTLSPASPFLVWKKANHQGLKMDKISGW